VNQKAKTIIVFFNLKDGVKESEYQQWAKEIDLPTVNKLNSVGSFEVFKGMGLFGEQKASPWDFFEVIKIHCEDAFLADIQTDVMSKVIEQFQLFTEDAIFVSTVDITAL
tara:strand:- start:2898 stop:3227 length:330 start_codon:yes stop_codon:yes gene_type:complete